ncbi:Na+/H+ antiporter NhaC [Kurthia huakuii]|uniref:Na+/H+ antiporter NhaC n=1 Tax=Kurthia huakuii TaxID=1421019 RepID=UPI000496B9DF|nr:Na+/H+ antiporter NhaC [Kurthia huakuii]MBM7699966.1 NhaC family Na+:H+ antiporter [Kurthia huakuii]
MFHSDSALKPTFFEASILLLLMIVIMAVSLLGFNSTPHIPVLFVIIMLLCYGAFKKVAYRTMEQGLVDGAKSGLAAIFIFFFIGILISTFMMSGTIPTMIYYGFELISGQFFFAIVFVVTCIIGVAVGSSLTTTATIGVAFIGMAQAMDLSLAITAGAIVSGAFFGDKMSPLSDTTNLASSIMNVDLFEHIKNMAWTTIPAFAISLIVYGVLSPSGKELANSGVADFQAALASTDLIHWYTLIPVVLLVLFALKKIPAIPTLIVGSIVAIIISYFHHTYSGSEVLTMLFEGYKSTTGVAEIDSLLTRGGMSSMFFTISLVILALGMGGLLFKLGIIQAILAKIEHLFKTVGATITGAAATAIGVNLFIGEQYLSILLPAETFQKQFAKVGLASKNLARTVEDAGTVVNPLIPWSVCGIFIAGVLQVNTLDYAPFAFFCLLSPILTILFGWTGKTLTYLNK